MTDRSAPRARALRQRAEDEIAELLVSHGASAAPDSGEIFAAARTVEREREEAGSHAREALAALLESAGTLLPSETRARAANALADLERASRVPPASVVAAALAVLDAAGPALHAVGDDAARIIRDALAQGGDLVPAAGRNEVLDALWRAETAPEGPARLAATAALVAAGAKTRAWIETWRAELEAANGGAPDASDRVTTLRPGTPMAELARAVRDRRRPRASNDDGLASSENSVQALEAAISAARGSAPSSAALGRVVESATATLAQIKRGVASASAALGWIDALDHVRGTAPVDGDIEAARRALREHAATSANDGDRALADAARALEDRLRERASDLPLRVIVDTRRVIERARTPAAQDGAAVAAAIETATRAIDATARAMQDARARETESRRAGFERAAAVLGALDDKSAARAAASLREAIGDPRREDLDAVALRAKKDGEAALRALAERASSALARANARAEGKALPEAAALQTALSSGDPERCQVALRDLQRRLGPEPVTRPPLWSWIAGAALPVLALVAVLLAGGSGARSSALTITVDAPVDAREVLHLVDAAGVVHQVAFEAGASETSVDLPAGRYTVVHEERFTGITITIPGTTRVAVPLSSDGSTPSGVTR